MKASTLSPANAEHYAQLVREGGLPLAGLLTSTECFEFCDDQDTIVGFAGLQRVGADALLRSLVVFPARQKAGFGSAIVGWIVSFASSNGISRLFAAVVVPRRQLQGANCARRARHAGGAVQTAPARPCRGARPRQH